MFVCLFLIGKRKWKWYDTVWAGPKGLIKRESFLKILWNFHFYFFLSFFWGKKRNIYNSFKRVQNSLSVYDTFLMLFFTPKNREGEGGGEGKQKPHFIFGKLFLNLRSYIIPSYTADELYMNACKHIWIFIANA